MKQIQSSHKTPKKYKPTNNYQALAKATVKASRSPRVSEQLQSAFWGPRPGRTASRSPPLLTLHPDGAFVLPPEHTQAAGPIPTLHPDGAFSTCPPASCTLGPSAPHNHHQGRFLPTPRFPLNSSHSQLLAPWSCHLHGALHVTPPPGGTFFPSHLKLVTFSGTFQIHVLVLTRIPWLPKPRQHELF